MKQLGNLEHSLNIKLTTQRIAHHFCLVRDQHRRHHGLRIQSVAFVAASTFQPALVLSFEDHSLWHLQLFWQLQFFSLFASHCNLKRSIYKEV